MFALPAVGTMGSKSRAIERAGEVVFLASCKMRSRKPGVVVSSAISNWPACDMVGKFADRGRNRPVSVEESPTLAATSIFKDDCSSRHNVLTGNDLIHSLMYQRLMIHGSVQGVRLA